MARTGENYQRARTALLAMRAAREVTPANVGVDLVPFRYFGVPMALGTFEIAGRLAALWLSGPKGPGPFPRNPLLGLGSSRSVH
jgi:hypothetical protein